MDDTLYSVMDVAKRLRIGKNRVYELIHAGLLPALNLGGLKVRKISLCKFLEDFDGFDLSDANNITKLNIAQLA